MAPPKMERFELRIDEEQLAQVDAWSQEQPDRPPRSEAVRRLLNVGLSAGSNRSVRFSDGEKMLMLMMRDLYKRFDIKEPECNPNFLAQVIYGGHYWAPKWDMQGVFHDHVDDPQDVKFVINALEMWGMIEAAFKQLDAPIQKAVAADAAIDPALVKFPGFDGSSETDFLSITRFVIDDMRRFQQFKGRDLNSHAITSDRYRRMLDIFEPIRTSMIGQGLSAVQLTQLLCAYCSR